MEGIGVYYTVVLLCLKHFIKKEFWQTKKVSHYDSVYITIKMTKLAVKNRWVAARQGTEAQGAKGDHKRAA